MKSETELVARLEKVVAGLENFAKAIEGIEKPTVEQAGSIAFLVGMVFAYGVALDCEDTVKAIASQMRLVAVVENLKGVL